LASKDAIIDATHSEEWASTFSGAAADTAANIKKIADNDMRISRNRETFHFWEHSQRYVELIKPMSDAIHQLEADLPFASQAYSVLMQLQQHVTAFCTKHADKPEIVDRVQVPTCVLCAVIWAELCVCAYAAGIALCCKVENRTCPPRSVGVRRTSAISSTQAAVACRLHLIGGGSSAVVPLAHPL
jgi:hypothetical protein